MNWLDELERLEKAADLDPLKSTHIISPGYQHMANLTEIITEPGGGGRGRCIAMVPKEWADYIAAAVNANHRLIEIARAAEGLRNWLELTDHDAEYERLRKALEDTNV